MKKICTYEQHVDLSFDTIFIVVAQKLTEIQWKRSQNGQKLGHLCHIIKNNKIIFLIFFLGSTKCNKKYETMVFLIGW